MATIKHTTPACRRTLDAAVHRDNRFVQRAAPVLEGCPRFPRALQPSTLLYSFPQTFPNRCVRARPLHNCGRRYAMLVGTSGAGEMSLRSKGQVRRVRERVEYGTDRQATKSRDHQVRRLVQAVGHTPLRGVCRG